MKTPITTLNLAALSLFLVAATSACGPASSDDPDQTGPLSGQARSSERTTPVAAKPAPVPVCNNCGTVTQIEPLKAKGSASGAGAVAGAVVGAVIGHQIGSGRGNDAATVAGAIGGGFAGNEIEKRARGTTYYRVTVGMESGGIRTLEVNALNGLTTGTRVKVIGNDLQVIAT